MIQEERTTTTARHLQDILRSLESQTNHVILHLREAQANGSPHAEAALIRVHDALGEAMRHLREAEAPFSDVTYEGQSITPVRVQDLDDPSSPPTTS